MKLAGLVAVLALAAPSSAHAFADDQRVDAFASWVAERPVHVRWVTPDEQNADPVFQTYHPKCFVGAEFWPGGQWFFNDWTACQDRYLPGALDVLYGTPGRASTTADEGAAILYILHESYHMHGNWDGRCRYDTCYSPHEDQTECMAITHFRAALEHLAIRGPEQDALYAAALAAHRSMIERNPIYADPACQVAA